MYHYCLPVKPQQIMMYIYAGLQHLPLYSYCYKNVVCFNLPVVLYWCESLSLALRGTAKLSVSENVACRKALGLKADK